MMGFGKNSIPEQIVIQPPAVNSGVIDIALIKERRW